jgi:serine/threonine protein kinase
MAEAQLPLDIKAFSLKPSLIDPHEVAIHEKDSWYGSFGVVKKGTWDGRVVAIKSILLRADPSDDIETVRSVQSFEAEANILYSLRHPNVVQVHTGA